MSEFIRELSALLARYALTVEDAKAANLLFLQARRNARAARDMAQSLTVRSAGPCLMCGAPTEYRPTRYHTAKGDEWLDKVFAKWTNPTEIKYLAYDGLYINERPKSTVCAYSCATCYDIIARIEASACRAREDRVEREREEREAAIQAAFEDREAPLWLRTQSLTARFDQDFYEAHVALPYKAFLRTPYWDIVRRLKLKESGFNCELCARKGTLQVHHKTYAHHGNEHANLQDLIVLCRGCHAKFHDKLVSPDLVASTEGA